MASLTKKVYKFGKKLCEIWLIEIPKNDKEPTFLFLAANVADFLGYTRTRDAINRHVKAKWRKNWNEIKDAVFHGPLELPHNWQPNSVFLTEAGVYALVVRSKLQEAEDFQEWLFEEVLPSIRRTGRYGVSSDAVAAYDKQLADAQMEAMRAKLELSDFKLTVTKYDARIADLQLQNQTAVTKYEARVAELQRTIAVYEQRMMAMRDIAGQCERRTIAEYEGRVERMRGVISDMTRSNDGLGAQFLANAMYADAAVHQSDAVRDQMYGLRHRIVPVLDDRPDKDELLVVYYWWERGRMMLRVRRIQRAELELCDRLMERYHTQGRPPPAVYSWLTGATKYYQVVCPNAVTVWNKLRTTYLNFFYGLSEENTAKTIYKVLNADEIRSNYARDRAMCAQNLKKDAIKIEEFTAMELRDAEHAVVACLTAPEDAPAAMRSIVREQLDEVRAEASFAEPRLSRNSTTFSYEQIAEASRKYREYMLNITDGVVAFGRAVTQCAEERSGAVGKLML
ncbi:anti-repressor Ant [Heliothis virescens ascovirus 3f]|uniref:Bro22 n=1 Tax=Heliothis virescens ascovirus 3f TaxID=328614 RepID=A0A171PVP4_9VIRU|nr:anti-repressor Ant [Heliothis virescens ascovirus 3f]AJP09125.1 Bro22 [Heliothis virescens ascovirus 3f]